MNTGNMEPPEDENLSNTARSIRLLNRIFDNVAILSSEALYRQQWNLEDMSEGVLESIRAISETVDRTVSMISPYYSPLNEVSNCVDDQNGSAFEAADCTEPLERTMSSESLEGQDEFRVNFETASSHWHSADTAFPEHSIENKFLSTPEKQRSTGARLLSPLLPRENTTAPLSPTKLPAKASIYKSESELEHELDGDSSELSINEDGPSFFENMMAKTGPLPYVEDSFGASRPAVGNQKLFTQESNDAPSQTEDENISTVADKISDSDVEAANQEFDEIGDFVADLDKDDYLGDKSVLRASLGVKFAISNGGRFPYLTTDIEDNKENINPTLASVQPSKIKDSPAKKVSPTHEDSSTSDVDSSEPELEQSQKFAKLLAMAHAARDAPLPTFRSNLNQDSKPHRQADFESFIDLDGPVPDPVNDTERWSKYRLAKIAAATRAVLAVPLPDEVGRLAKESANMIRIFETNELPGESEATTSKEYTKAGGNEAEIQIVHELTGGQVQSPVVERSENSPLSSSGNTGIPVPASEKPHAIEFSLPSSLDEVLAEARRTALSSMDYDNIIVDLNGPAPDSKTDYEAWGKYTVAKIAQQCEEIKSRPRSNVAEGLMSLVNSPHKVSKIPKTEGLTNAGSPSKPLPAGIDSSTKSNLYKSGLPKAGLPKLGLPKLDYALLHSKNSSPIKRASPAKHGQHPKDGNDGPLKPKARPSARTQPLLHDTSPIKPARGVHEVKPSTPSKTNLPSASSRAPLANPLADRPLWGPRPSFVSSPMKDGQTLDFKAPPKAARLSSIPSVSHNSSANPAPHPVRGRRTTSTLSHAAQLRQPSQAVRHSLSIGQLSKIYSAPGSHRAAGGNRRDSNQQIPAVLPGSKIDKPKPPVKVKRRPSDDIEVGRRALLPDLPNDDSESMEFDPFASPLSAQLQREERLEELVAARTSPRFIDDSMELYEEQNPHIGDGGLTYEEIRANYLRRQAVTSTDRSESSASNSTSALMRDAMLRGVHEAQTGARSRHGGDKIALSSIIGNTRRVTQGLSGAQLDSLQSLLESSGANAGEEATGQGSPENMSASVLEGVSSMLQVESSYFLVEDDASPFADCDSAFPSPSISREQSTVDMSPASEPHKSAATPTDSLPTGHRHRVVLRARTMKGLVEEDKGRCKKLGKRWTREFGSKFVTHAYEAGVPIRDD